MGGSQFLNRPWTRINFIFAFFGFAVGVYLLKSNDASASFWNCVIAGMVGAGFAGQFPKTVSVVVILYLLGTYW